MKNNLDLIKSRIIEADVSIINALKKMDQESVKLLFVFKEGRFLSILTIGDIQRAIIKNPILDQQIVSILQKNKVYANEADCIDEIKKKMYDLRAECMPVVNTKGELISVFFWSDFFGSPSERTLINIPVVIMAGGLGTRLRPLTNVIPKPLIPINEKTILEVILDRFVTIGCTKFYISVNYKHEILEYYIKNLDKKYDIVFFKEEKPLGTIGSVSLLKDKINTPFFVSNCDNLIDQDLRDVYDYHLSNENDLTIVTAVKSYQIPYGVIETGENGLMLDISEKPDLNYKINTGIYVLQPQLIHEIPQNEFFHITHLMEKVKERNGKIGCFPISEKSWTDIGDWAEYLKIIKQ